MHSSFIIVIQLLCNGYHTFMDMAWVSVGYGLDIEGGGDFLFLGQIKSMPEILHLEFQYFDP